MLKDNIRIARNSKGLSQEELALKLHAVRQTVSKWERGLSVPDAGMLVSMSEIFEVPVSELLGGNMSMPEEEADELKAIAEKLEAVNLQLARRRRAQKKFILGTLIVICVVIVILTVLLLTLGSPYLRWDYDDSETAVMGTIIHSFEWLFVRVVPILLTLSIIGIVVIRKRY